MLAGNLHCQFEHRPQEAELRLTDSELRRVDSHRQAPGACSEIVAAKRALAALV